MRNINGYDLSRAWFDWCFENPERISPNHTALYFFIIEHCNRLGWKKKFGLPTAMAKDAIGIKSYKTYIKTLNELVDFGFIDLVEKSSNQHTANIVALVNFTEPHGKALDKAILNHMPKQVQSTCQTNSTIDKPITTKPITNNKGKSTSKNSAESISSKFEINKDWAEVVFDWLEYKKERRETYKSDRSVKSFITKLRNLSGDDPAVAREIVEQSFANNYAGVFGLKKQITNGKDRRDSETAIREQQIMQLAREAGMA